MKIIPFSILVFLAALIFSGCNLINPDEEIPSYIHIDTVKLFGKYDSVKSLSHNISDAWVFLDGNSYLGTFELPVTIPVLASGVHEITIQAGIIENGISNTRVAYPFYSNYSIDIDLKSGQVDTLTPSFSYLGAGITFLINEDFESPSMLFQETARNTASLKRSGEGMFEGNYSFRATLSPGDLFEIESTGLFSIPRNKSVFMELNYKTDIQLSIGYFAINVSDNTQHGFINLNPTDQWKKIYINFGTELTFEPINNNFKFFLGAINSTSQNDSFTVYLDNIKMIRFE